MFCCEVCEIFTNTYFEEHLRTTASIFILRFYGSDNSWSQKQSPEGVLKNFTKFMGKQLYQSLFFNKVAELRPATLLEKRLWHKCFPVNFVNNFWSTYFKGQYCMAASVSCSFGNTLTSILILGKPGVYSCYCLTLYEWKVKVC